MSSAITPVRFSPLFRPMSTVVLAGVLLSATALGVSTADAQPSATAGPLALGAAGSFSVLAAATVTNTGASVLKANLGVSPGSAVTGFPPGRVDGAVHAADATAAKAQVALSRAYSDAAARTGGTDLSGSDLGGRTLLPGVETFTSSAGLTGTLTLDGGGDRNSVFLFQIGSTLTTASASSVRLTNGAQACHVYWQVGSSATLGTSTHFAGTVLAQASITATTGATVHGRLLAHTAAVTLDTTTVTRAPCTS